MKINWKIRLQNKTWVVSMVCAVIAFVYQLLGLCGVVPAISEETLVQLVGMVANILVGLGILIDPTTKGIEDSDRAMTYGK